MIQFKHFPQGSTIGSGSIKFKHYGEEVPAGIRITLLGEMVYGSDDASTSMKIGSAPTSNNDTNK